jgi:hypothetical protein
MGKAHFYLLLEKEGAIVDILVKIYLFLVTLRAFHAKKCICCLWGCLNPLRITVPWLESKERLWGKQKSPWRSLELHLGFPSISKGTQFGRIAQLFASHMWGIWNLRWGLWNENGMVASTGDWRKSFQDFPEDQWIFRNFPLGKNSLEPREPHGGIHSTSRPNHLDRGIPAFSGNESTLEAHLALWALILLLRLRGWRCDIEGS